MFSECDVVRMDGVINLFGDGITTQLSVVAYFVYKHGRPQDFFQGRSYIFPSPPLSLPFISLPYHSLPFEALSLDPARSLDSGGLL